MKGEDQMGEMLLQKAAINNGGGQAKSGKPKSYACSKVTAESPPNPNSGETKSGSGILTLEVLIFLNTLYGITLILQTRGVPFPETAEAVIWGFQSGVSLLNAWYFYGEILEKKKKKKKKKQQQEEEEKEKR